MSFDLEKKLKETKQRLDKVSSCYCTAKWLQVTLHLQHGNTHSCHHPTYHKVPLDELKNNPSALHNTKFKKEQRKLMLEGKRPPECQYCWNVEDTSKDQYSDRFIKSSDPWSIDKIEEIAQMPWDQDINPTYMEVSFGHGCNLACSYCLPDVSSSLFNELREFGPSPSGYCLDMEGLEKEQRVPTPVNEANPYVDAFWKWYPSLKNDLKVFRITGGEPLINPNTFKLIDYHIENPCPDLDLAINSNLCIPEKVFNSFLEKLEKIEIGKHFKDLQIYASMDGFGSNAEYIRHGSDYDLVMNRIRILLEKFPSLKVSLMCTYNIFSVVHFKKYLEDVLDIKKKFGINDKHPDWSRLLLDISYLRYPPYFSIEILPKEKFGPFIQESIKFMEDNQSVNGGEGFAYYEVNKLQRVYDWFQSVEQRDDYHMVRYDFYRTVIEYDKRRNTNIYKSCPEYIEFLDTAKVAYEKMNEELKSAVWYSEQRMKWFKEGKKDSNE